MSHIMCWIILQNTSVVFSYSEVCQMLPTNNFGLNQIGCIILAVHYAFNVIYGKWANHKFTTFFQLCYSSYSIIISIYTSGGQFCTESFSSIQKVQVISGWHVRSECTWVLHSHSIIAQRFDHSCEFYG